MNTHADGQNNVNEIPWHLSRDDMMHNAACIGARVLEMIRSMQRRSGS